MSPSSGSMSSLTQLQEQLKGEAEERWADEWVGSCPAPACWLKCRDQFHREMWVHENGAFPPQREHPLQRHFQRLQLAISALQGHETEMSRQAHWELIYAATRSADDVKAVREDWLGPVRVDGEPPAWEHRESGLRTCINPSEAPEYLWQVMQKSVLPLLLQYTEPDLESQDEVPLLAAAPSDSRIDKEEDTDVNLCPAPNAPTPPLRAASSPAPARSASKAATGSHSSPAASLLEFALSISPLSLSPSSDLGTSSEVSSVPARPQTSTRVAKQENSNDSGRQGRLRGPNTPSTGTPTGAGSGGGLPSATPAQWHSCNSSLAEGNSMSGSARSRLEAPIERPSPPWSLGRSLRTSLFQLGEDSPDIWSSSVPWCSPEALEDHRRTGPNGLLGGRFRSSAFASTTSGEVGKDGVPISFSGSGAASSASSTAAVGFFQLATPEGLPTRARTPGTQPTRHFCMASPASHAATATEARSQGSSHVISRSCASQGSQASSFGLTELFDRPWALPTVGCMDLLRSRERHLFTSPFTIGSAESGTFPSVAMESPPIAEKASCPMTGAATSEAESTLAASGQLLLEQPSSSEASVPSPIDGGCGQGPNSYLLQGMAVSKCNNTDKAARMDTGGALRRLLLELTHFSPSEEALRSPSPINIRPVRLDFRSALEDSA
mmetsp:Transcript_75893/g.158253  ORF Transcript_75893/g.158253 Transcript_75893/m.158253 type:complete len:667 (+) Transcript_75893:58-2058(+)